MEEKLSLDRTQPNKATGRTRQTPPNMQGGCFMHQHISCYVSQATAVIAHTDASTDILSNFAVRAQHITQKYRKSLR